MWQEDTPDIKVWGLSSSHIICIYYITYLVTGGHTSPGSLQKGNQERNVPDGISPSHMEALSTNEAGTFGWVSNDYFMEGVDRFYET